MSEVTETKGLPEFVSFGEALTDMIRVAPDQWKSVPGGAPWNVAMVMSYFGIPSAFGGAISSDCFGDEIWKTTVHAKLDLRFTQRLQKSPLLAIVHETHPPKYYFIGDDSADLHFDVAALPEGWEKAVRWAHFGCISLARQPLADRLVALRGHGGKLGQDEALARLKAIQTRRSTLPAIDTGPVPVPERPETGHVPDSHRDEVRGRIAAHPRLALAAVAVGGLHGGSGFALPAPLLPRPVRIGRMTTVLQDAMADPPPATLIAAFAGLPGPVAAEEARVALAAGIVTFEQDEPGSFPPSSEQAR